MSSYYTSGYTNSHDQQDQWDLSQIYNLSTSPSPSHDSSYSGENVNPNMQFATPQQPKKGKKPSEKGPRLQTATDRQPKSEPTSCHTCRHVPASTKKVYICRSFKIRKDGSEKHCRKLFCENCIRKYPSFDINQCPACMKQCPCINCNRTATKKETNKQAAGVSNTAKPPRAPRVLNNNRQHKRAPTSKRTREFDYTAPSNWSVSSGASSSAYSADYDSDPDYLPDFTLSDDENDRNRFGTVTQSTIYTVGQDEEQHLKSHLQQLGLDRNNPLMQMLVSLV